MRAAICTCANQIQTQMFSFCYLLSLFLQRANQSLLSQRILGAPLNGGCGKSHICLYVRDVPKGCYSLAVIDVFINGRPRPSSHGLGYQQLIPTSDRSGSALGHSFVSSRVLMASRYQLTSSRALSIRLLPPIMLTEYSSWEQGTACGSLLMVGPLSGLQLADDHPRKEMSTASRSGGARLQELRALDSSRFGWAYRRRRHTAAKESRHPLLHSAATGEVFKALPAERAGLLPGIPETFPIRSTLKHSLFLQSLVIPSVEAGLEISLRPVNAI